MPLLAKKQPQYPALADAGTDTQSPCEKILNENNDTSGSGNESGSGSGSGLPMIQQTTSWVKANKSWLPWAVAAGFGLLWITKSKNKNQ